MMKCDDVIQQKLDKLTKRMLDTAKLDKEKISKSSKAMKLAKKFMGNMEKTSDSEDRQKRIIGMIDKFYKTSYSESEASEDDDTDSEDDDFEVEKLMMGNARVNEEKTFESEVDTSTKKMLGTAKLNKEKTSKSSEVMKLVKNFRGDMEKTSDSEVGHKKIIERFNKLNELKASVWESEFFEDDDFIGKFKKEMYSESEASEDDYLEELFFPGVKAIRNTKMKCDDVIQHSDKFEKLKKRMMGNTSFNEEKASESDGEAQLSDKFEKLKKRMMGNTSLNEEKASESEGISSCPELVGLAELENDNAIVLRGGTEAPLCASVGKDGKLTKSPRIAFE